MDEPQLGPRLSILRHITNSILKVVKLWHDPFNLVSFKFFIFAAFLLTRLELGCTF